jgi:putative hydrolase of the HAD superfamily
MADGMATEATVTTVLLDGMGTLLRLVPPAPALAQAFGIDEATAERGFRAEVAYYLEHHLEGRDEAGLADLRRRCAAVLATAVDAKPETALSALMASIRFEAWPDAAPALEALRGRGLRLVVVSNWDCSLPSVLDSVGLLALVDGVVTSAAAGAAKPDPRIFQAALELAGCAPAEALHVGDSAENDVAGAAAVGIRALLLDRDGASGPDHVTTLTEIPALLG